MAFKGNRKKTYQREYMRRYRLLNKGSNGVLRKRSNKMGFELKSPLCEVDADGNAIPEE